MNATEPKLERLDKILTGTIFRFPGCGSYYIKINAECRGNEIKAVCIGGGMREDEGEIIAFKGELEAIAGRLGPALVHLGF